jgi:hypothetical protein
MDPWTKRTGPLYYSSFIDVYIYTGLRILAALWHLHLEILSEAQRSALCRMHSLLITPGRTFRSTTVIFA